MLEPHEGERDSGAPLYRRRWEDKNIRLIRSRREFVGENRAAEQARLGASHHQTRDVLKQSLIRWVRLKRRKELLGIEQRSQPRSNAAGDIDPAERLEGERKPTGEAAEEAHKQLGRLERGGFSGERIGHDLFGRAASSAWIDGMCQASETRPRNHHLGTDVPVLAEEVREDFHLVGGLRTERGMAPLAGDHLPAIGYWHESGHTETGARA